MQTLLLRLTLWGGGTLLLLGMFMYGFFWLPYRDPERHVPRLVEILPHEPPSDDGVAEPPKHYAWVDPAKRVVQIPIDEAMQIVAEQLAVSSRADVERDSPPSRRIPNDAGSGRYVVEPQPTAPAQSPLGGR